MINLGNLQGESMFCILTRIPRYTLRLTLDPLHNRTGRSFISELSDIQSKGDREEGHQDHLFEGPKNTYNTVNSGMISLLRNKIRIS